MSLYTLGMGEVNYGCPQHQRACEELDGIAKTATLNLFALVATEMGSSREIVRVLSRCRKRK